MKPPLGGAGMAPKLSSINPPRGLVAAPAMSSHNMLAMGYCVLLALQFGLQPTLVKSFTPDSISKKTIVITTEVSKILITIASLFGGEKTERDKIFKSWTFADSLKQAAVPAILYALQNVLTQYGYSMLDSMTFNLLNQTKILSSALCLWIVLKQKQSMRQIFALLILLQAAILLSLPKDILKTAADASFALVPTITNHLQKADFINAFHASLSLPRNLITTIMSNAQSANVGVSGARYRSGVLMVIGASALSGVSAALTQRSLQQAQRNALFYSAEMAVYGIVALLASSVKLVENKGTLTLDYSSGISELTRGVALEDIPIWSRSPMWVLIPIIVNAFGGLIVGLVTKYAGGVNKGFAIIAGLFLSGVVQWVHEKKPLGLFDFLAAAMVTLSLWLHQTKGWGSGATAAAAAAAAAAAPAVASSGAAGGKGDALDSKKRD